MKNRPKWSVQGYISPKKRIKMNSCIISLGSNIDSEKNIAEAIRLIAASFQLIKTSGFIRTKPIGMVGQPDFANGAVLIRTEMNLENLTATLKKIEDQMGRDRTQAKFGPRNIDLDVLVWNGVLIDQDYFTRDFLRTSAEELGFKIEIK